MGHDGITVGRGAHAGSLGYMGGRAAVSNVIVTNHQRNTYSPDYTDLKLDRNHVSVIVTFLMWAGLMGPASGHLDIEDIQNNNGPKGVPGPK